MLNEVRPRDEIRTYFPYMVRSFCLGRDEEMNYTLIGAIIGITIVYGISRIKVGKKMKATINGVTYEGNHEAPTTPTRKGI